MAWASKKLYAILMSSEEGKDILEGIGEKSQDEFDKEVDAFLGNSGKGTSQNADYKKKKEETQTKDNENNKELKETKKYPKLNPKRPFGEKQKEIDGWIDEYLNDADVLGSDYYGGKNQPNRENLFKEISSNFPNDEIEHPQKKQYIYDKIDKAIENRDYTLSKGYIQDFDELDDEIEDYIYDELLPQNVSEEEALNYVLTYLGEDGEEPYVRNYFKNKISKIYKE